MRFSGADDVKWKPVVDRGALGWKYKFGDREPDDGAVGEALEQNGRNREVVGVRRPYS